MIVKTEAIVLKTMKYRETSKIATLFTKRFGKLSVIAKGARQRDSRVGSALDSLNYVQAVLYKKEGKDLHLLSQCDVIKHFGRLTREMDRLSPAMTVLELIQTVAHAEEESSSLFEALTDALETINDAQQNVQSVLLHFELRLLDLLGFRPDLMKCAGCRKTLESVTGGTKSGFFRLSPGGFFCTGCGKGSGGSAGAARETIKVLRELQNISSIRASELILSPSCRDEARKILWYFLRSHVEGMKRLKSEAVFSAVA